MEGNVVLSEPTYRGNGFAPGIRRSDLQVQLYKYSKTPWFGYNMVEVESTLHPAPILNQEWVTKFMSPVGEEEILREA